MTSIENPTIKPTTNLAARAAADRGGRRPARSDLYRSIGPFIDLGVLDAADVHAATTMCRLAGEDDDTVRLAIALAIRAARLGSVTVDLTAVATTVSVDDDTIDLTTLAWPEPTDWVAAVAASPVVAVGDDGSVHPDRPVRLLGTEVMLDRYWRHERQIAADLVVRAGPDLLGTLTDESIARLIPTDPGGFQRQAVATAIASRLTVVAGGPGTGKTTTVAAILAALHATSPEPLRIALAAPTGKAAARLTEAIHSRIATLDTTDEIRAAVMATEASTLHRLLGRAPGTSSRFRHHRGNPLPHHVIIVDETSMVSLALMSRLLEAIRPTARVILVGDPQQLTSVEAGAVLGDIVGPAALPQVKPDAGNSLDGRVVVLRTSHRYGGGVGELAEAVEIGDADAVIDVLSRAPDGVSWHPVDVAPPAAGPYSAEANAALDDIRASVVGPARAVVDAARAGDGATALAHMAEIQVLCAHRRGHHGVSWWRHRIEHWLTDELTGYVPTGWYAGRPLLVTANDYSLDLFNGDTGVVVDLGDRLAGAFERRGEIVHVAPSRLSAVETVYAMTIHKSQGSQFNHVVCVLPKADAPILTRELFYTAVTRAQDRVAIVGTAESIRSAINRPVARASGLRRRLWTPTELPD